MFFDTLMKFWRAAASADALEAAGAAGVGFGAPGGLALEAF
jgi:hypothetical protein